MSKASVESSPPDMPTTTFWHFVCAIRWQRAADWIERISSYRSWASLLSGKKGYGCIFLQVFSANNGNVSVRIARAVSLYWFLQAEKVVFCRLSWRIFAMSMSATDSCCPIEKRCVFFQKCSVFVNNAVAAEHYIGRWFAKATRTVYVSGNGACRLIGKERAEVIVFARTFVWGRKIENDFGTFQCQIWTWRNRCPKVFAKFYAEFSVWSFKQQIVSDRYLLTTDWNFFCLDFKCRWKPSFFVKFFSNSADNFSVQCRVSCLPAKQLPRLKADCPLARAFQRLIRCFLEPCWR